VRGPSATRKNTEISDGVEKGGSGLQICMLKGVCHK
jgi:hypothetical protein